MSTLSGHLPKEKAADGSLVPSQAEIGTFGPNRSNDTRGRAEPGRGRAGRQSMGPVYGRIGRNKRCGRLGSWDLHLQSPNHTGGLGGGLVWPGHHFALRPAVDGSGGTHEQYGRAIGHRGSMQMVAAMESTKAGSSASFRSHPLRQPIRLRSGYTPVPRQGKPTVGDVCGQPCGRGTCLHVPRIRACQGPQWRARQ